VAVHLSYPTIRDCSDSLDNAMASSSEMGAIVCLLVSAIAAIAGHWKLGVATPVWDASTLLQAYSAAQGAVTADTAVNVLTRSARNWQGKSHAALVHEALGRVRVRDGDLSGALRDIRQAAHVSDGVAEAVPDSVLDSVRARVRVKEGELLLLAGDYMSAIEAVGDSINAGADHRARPARLRVESLKVLITAAIQLTTSAEELTELQGVFEKTKESIEGQADPATKALIYDVTALLVEAQGDLEGTISALDLAITHSQRATDVGSALKRARHRQPGDAVLAAELASLHCRMSLALRKRAASGDLTQAGWHQSLAGKLSPDMCSPDAGTEARKHSRDGGSAHAGSKVGELSQDLGSADMGTEGGAPSKNDGCADSGTEGGELSKDGTCPRTWARPGLDGSGADVGTSAQLRTTLLSQQRSAPAIP